MSGNHTPGYPPESFVQYPPHLDHQLYPAPTDHNNNNNIPAANGNNLGIGIGVGNDKPSSISSSSSAFPLQDPAYYQQQAYPYQQQSPSQGFQHQQQHQQQQQPGFGGGGGGYDQSTPGAAVHYPYQQSLDLSPPQNPYYSSLPSHHQTFTPQQQQLAGASTHPYAAAYADAVAFTAASVSPQPYAHAKPIQQQTVASPLQWQQQQQQQQQQLLLQQQQQAARQTLSPAALQQSPPIAVAPSPSPAPIPSHPPPQNGNASTPSRVPKITLRLAAPTSTAEMSSRRRNSRAAAAHTPIESPDDSHGRPRRASRAATKVNYAVDDDDDDDFEDESEATPQPQATRRGRGRGRPAKQHPDEEDEAPHVGTSYSTRRSTRGSAAKAPEPEPEPEPEYVNEDDFEDKLLPTSPPPVEQPRPKRKGRYIADPDEDDEEEFQPPVQNGAVDAEPAAEKPRSQRSRGARHSSADNEEFEPSSDEETPSEASSPDPIANDNYEDDDEAFVEHDSPRRPARRPLRSSAAATSTRRSTRNSRRNDSEEEEGGPRRNLRKRNQVDYTLPPIDLTAELAAAERNANIMNQAMGGGGPRGGRGFGGSFPGMRKFPWMSKPKDNLGAQAMGDPDSSDSDDNLQMAGPSRAAGPAGPAGPNVPGPTDVPNFGRFNPKSSTADADPLGVDVNVTFDRVGGLDNHINQLKEMVALPLLYPELFKQFGIIPPRGVLFHGPPGTGKTLVARALAASCTNGNTKISFFMRKGADVLSKWVGEAERQLRMLFEEARASQPSIIFFDEIDGLAPVRSSKQDQIHASLVSTLLALMDGMDGRGQVIVIGATNRPDAVDPALRRPGRFDREFYFPLPNLDARREIIKINTRDWDPQLPDEMLNTLATLTKGYGGADLRALCTESALNAIQRKYPQIYKTNDRLQVQPASIRVQPKDFMLAVKKIIPSSARSASSAAMQLPKQLVPLLSNDLERLKTAIDRALPPAKNRTALEEAEYEDEDGDSFEKEIMLQSLDKLRTYRPRLLVYGPRGGGQTYLGPAILHHLEGFHVQSFDLATLMSDSTRTTEAAIVQLFVEAKRHQPSVIFIPSLSQWSATITDTARATTRALLDGIPPSDPILLLAIVDGPLSTLPPDVRSWFGFGHENRVEIGKPGIEQRSAFFAELLESISRKPTDFPDGVPRKRRVLEELPLAEPLPPRQPTQAEIARDMERDNAARNMITLSFTSLLSEFARKYRRPVAMAREAAFSYAAFLAEQAANETASQPAPAINVEQPANGQPPLMEVSGEAPVAQLAVLPPTALPDSQVSDVVETYVSTEPSLPAVPPNVAALAREAVEGSAVPSETAAPKFEAHDIDIDLMQTKLVKHKYYTPGEFLADIALIEENSKALNGTPEQLKVCEMCAHAKSHVLSFDPKWNPEFERYAQRMHERKAERKAKREKEKAEAEAKEKAEAEARDKAEAELANGRADGVNGLKRAREDGEEATDGAPAEKRARDDQMDVDPIESIQNGSTQLTAVESIHSMPPTQPDGVVLDKDKSKSPTPGPTKSQSKSPTAEKASTPAAKEPTPPRAPSPPPVYPDFVVPSLTQLATTLKHGTSELNVEELEQLRATLLDCVWRARSTWDRTALVKEMLDRALSFIDEVKEVRSMERKLAQGEDGFGF